MIKVFGDSHSRIFKKINLDKFKIDVDSISGASLNGLCKINSKLNINQKIINYLKNNKPDFLILKFGQVDIDLNYYYKIVVKNENININNFVKNLIHNYIIFILNISNYIPLSNIIIFGINPPTLIDQKSCFNYTKRIILDNNNSIKFKQKLFNNIKSIEIRTHFSIIFNHILKNQCFKNNIKFTNVFNDFLENNIISKKFTNNNDHHIKGIENDKSNFNPTINLFKKSLINIIYN